MEPTDIVVLEWTFSPPNYFEGLIRIKCDKYELIINNGKAEAKVKSEVYGKNPHMREDLQNSINDRFLGVQVLSHSPYELSTASMYRVHPDGSKDSTNIIEASVTIPMVTLSCDSIVRDKYGNVVSDSRQERINNKKKFANLSEKYGNRDATVASLLRSYKNAVNDPNNELVHLFEISDALAKRFGGKGAACNTLEISTAQWSRLGLIANNETLIQGRHRGKTLGMLRDATEAELTEARNAARQFIEAYLEYLERHNEDNKTAS